MNDLDISKEQNDRYLQKTEYLYKILDKIKSDNIEYYEPFINVPFAKNIIKYRFSYKLEDEYMVEYVLENTIENLFEESLKSINKKDKYEFILSSYINESSKELQELLDDFSFIDYGNFMDNEIKQYKYLILGNKHLQYLNFLDNKELNCLYLTKYKNIKIYIISNLDNMYLLNGPIIDLNSINISYHDTLDSEIDDIDLFHGHNGIITLNTIMGDIDVVEIECRNDEFANKKFKRYLKLKRVIK